MTDERIRDVVVGHAAGRPRHRRRDRDDAMTDWKMQAMYLATALDFYADPETYFGIAFWPDPPCGPFDEDVSWVEHDLLPGYRPGKLARETLAAFNEVWEHQ